MPAFRYKLTRDQVASLAVYIRSFAAHQPGSAPAAAPPSHLTAENIYATSCWVCHDTTGKGNVSFKMNPAAKDLPDFTDPSWQKSRTDAQLAQSILEGTGPGKLMVSRRAELGSVDVKDMVALVRRFEGGKYVVDLEKAKPSGPALPPPIPEPVTLDLPARDVAALGGLLGSPSGYGPLFATARLGPAAVVAVGPEPPPPVPGQSEEEAERIRVGMTIFRGYCITCHGPDGKGTLMRPSMPLIPDFTSEAFHRAHPNNFELQAIILGGRNLMPANAGRVTADQALDLVAYIRTFGPRGVIPPPGGSDAEFAESVRRLEAQLDALHKQLQETKGKP
jgi:mono/diheme cytochrome c family protein